MSTLLLLALAAAPADEPLLFDRDVRPLLSSRCFACHGPDEAARQADLRLDAREHVLADRGGYAAVVPGEPDTSELVARILDAEDPMPPADSELALTEAGDGGWKVCSAFLGSSAARNVYTACVRLRTERTVCAQKFRNSA